MKKNKASYIILSLSIFIFGILATLLFLSSRGMLGVSSSNNGACYTSCTNKVTITDNGSISAAVDKIYDAVVLVENYVNNKLSSTGTGFVYKVDNNYGYIITNYHVINGNTSIKIIMSNDEEIKGTYLGGEQYLDVAVISIPKDKVKKVAEIGNSDNTELGDTVFTIGTPVDKEYKGTVTKGILSGKNRLVGVSYSSTTEEDYVMSVLQTDAAINPGNSGGPLVNINGEVIGVNSLKLVKDSIEGMGFALPIEYVMNNIDKLEKGLEIERPLIGISMANITDTYSLYRQGITIPSSVSSGVVVVSTVNNTDASSKLQKGDIITKIDGEKITNMAYLRYELFKHNVGDTIKVTYLRNNKEATTSIKLSKNTNK